MKTDTIIQARVIAEHRGLYRVKKADQEYSAKVSGKQMFEASGREDFPAVGDFVVIEIIDDGQAIIKSILPRRTTIRKRQGKEIQVIAANIDVAFIVESVDRDYNLNRLERYCILCVQEKIEPVIVINKIDLISINELEIKLTQIVNRLKRIEVLPATTSTEEGLNELKKHIESDKTYCFLGSSGVGKSTMINKLIGEEVLATREIGKGTGRGKHTTTHREMFFLENGGILIDNPGMREVGLADFEAGLEQVFDGFESLSKRCKFADCTHISETGCAVLEAIKSGKLDRSQYDNYLKLKKEVDFYEMSDQEKRAKDHKFGKYIKNSLKKFDKYQ